MKSIKMLRTYLAFFSLLLIIFVACDDVRNVKEVTIQDIQKYLSEISSDKYEGRKPFTEGEEKTVKYLQQELERMGVAPGNGGSYIQEVPLVEITGHPDTSMYFNSPEAEIVLNLKKDFVCYTERIEETVKIEDSEVVFCGFGITAPEYDWDDFEGVDVKGKTIIVLVNDPGFGGEDESFFKGNTMTYYGRWTYKYEEAARQGAAAVLIIHETASAGYPWFVVEGAASGAKLNLKPNQETSYKAGVQGWISLDMAKSIFEKAGFDLGSEIRKARTKAFEPFSLGYTMSHTLHNMFKYDQSRNVIGILPGTTSPEEYLIFSAHWDHLGIGKTVDGDSIYNGALDNGSGIASVLSIAKAMSQSPALERSVVFLFVTAEEQGLLGSQYYAENPIFPVDLTVANLNLDGMNPFGPMKYLTITGIGHSEMDDYAREEAAKQGRDILPDQEPEKGYFFRSDHFNFAKVGIPALYAEGAYEHMELGKEYVKDKRADYVANRYHQPADEYVAEDWDLRGIAQDAQFDLNVANRLGNEKTWPEWKEGSEFKNIRNQSKLKN
ncbi:MAG: M28 family peptidase [Saprospiraceae bacterium]|nr:M28 family peptidase [Saprospiraceae bacterium]